MNEDKPVKPAVYRPASVEQDDAASAGTDSTQSTDSTQRPTEIGGRKGPDPTRYGDWEKNGRCIDF